MNSNFDLFKSANIDILQLKNRFIRSATWEGMCKHGFVSEKLIKLYTSLAENEIGLIITGYSHVMENANSNYGQMAIYDDKFVPYLKTLTEKVHDFGAKICIQLVHCGGQAIKPEAPSPIKTPFYKKIPEELSIKKIIKIQDAFEKAAERAILSGFDAIQLHAAHGYLISQFLSPVSNQRNDKYGGSLENRAKFLIEVFEKVKKITDNNIFLFIKINCEDFLINGLKFEETLKILKWLKEIGLKAVEISGGMRGAKKTPIITNIKNEKDEAYWKNYAKKIKEQLELNVVLVGGLRSLSVIEKLYKENFADFFSFSRPLIKEPHLIKRWKNGDIEKSKCISCNRCFIPAKKQEGIRCLMD